MPEDQSVNTNDSTTKVITESPGGASGEVCSTGGGPTNVDGPQQESTLGSRGTNDRSKLSGIWHRLTHSKHRGFRHLDGSEPDEPGQTRSAQGIGSVPPTGPGQTAQSTGEEAGANHITPDKPSDPGLTKPGDPEYYFGFGDPASCFAGTSYRGQS